jgi:predicted RNA-binding protein with PIN domain
MVRGVPRPRYRPGVVVTEPRGANDRTSPALPDEVQAALVRGIGAFVRVAESRQLPASIRRYRGWRQQALAQHRGALIGALEDADFRAEVLEWLDEDRPRMQPSDVAVLRAAAERGPGWEDELAATTGGRAGSQGTEPGASGAGRDDADVAREQARAKRARADLRKAKEQARAALDAADRELGELRRERAELVARLDAATAEVAELQSAAASARADADRRVRRATRDADRYRDEAGALRAELKRSRRALHAAETDVANLRAGRPQVPRASATTGDPKLGPRSIRRRPLDVPKGRLPEDPQTLDDWLGRSGWLLVDGYNVTKAEGGFSGLPLEAQRERLVEEIMKLATRKKLPTTIVFDGSRVPPGTRRRRRGPVAVEYSNPHEPADDHLVALLETGGPEPAVLVTSDRDLGDRAGALGATVARSEQLLALIR